LQLLLAPFSKFPESFVAFVIAIGIAGLMVFIFLRAASTAEGRPSALRRMIRLPNTRIGFALLFVVWALIFGIGLTIVKHVVEAHGGRVTVRSAVGQGSRFTIELPVNPNATGETSSNPD